MLTSFKISALLLFLDFKYLETLDSGAKFLSKKVLTKIKNFDNYFDVFKEFHSNNSLFIEYMEEICYNDEDDFIRLLNTV